MDTGDVIDKWMRIFVVPNQRSELIMVTKSEKCTESVSSRIAPWPLPPCVPSCSKGVGVGGGGEECLGHQHQRWVLPLHSAFCCIFEPPPLRARAWWWPGSLN